MAAGIIKSGQVLKSTKFPPNKGFDGEPTLSSLEPGTIIDRYGYEGGRYAAPKGTPFAERSLPAKYENTMPLRTYEVLVSIEGVWEGKTASWYGQPGGGIQYLLPYTIDRLRHLELIRPIE